MLVAGVLTHHGIRGMKWGVRKASSSEGSPKPEASSDHLTVVANRKKMKAGGVKALSNAELQQIVTRMNLEQQHRTLMEQRPSAFEKGHARVKKVLAVGKTMQEIYGMYNSPAGKAVKKLIQK